MSHSNISESSVQGFSLDPSFVAGYADKKPDFGFNGLGEFTYRRTYSRLKADGTNEQWFETVQRVVEGTYTIQKEHILAAGKHWNEAKAQKSAQEMYDRIFTMKFLPPGRGLWMMGTEFVKTRGGTALNNCAFISTANLAPDFAYPFAFMMDATMLGVGVGFDTLGAGSFVVQKPGHRRYKFVVPDTREGWVMSVKRLLYSYSDPDAAYVEFDYSQVRPAGAPIKGFGGVASGPGPLIDLHNNIRMVLDPLVGKPITQRAIVDIMNMIGCCVVAGNVRRSAQIALGDASTDYLDLKNYEVNPDRGAYGWASNNSIKATIGMDYTEAAKRVAINGEPGFFWQENVSTYGRMGEEKHDPATGINPCAEQPLESGEMCTLVETFPARHESMADYERTIKFAYLYAKTVTLTTVHWPESAAVMKKNRRIGLSMSGVAQFISKNSLDDLKHWCNESYKTVCYYDKLYSGWLGIEESIRMTTIKPSGTVSLLAGATPGVHYPESRFYIRRVRVAKNSPLWKEMADAGYTVEPSTQDPENTMVVEFPVDGTGGFNIPTQDEISMKDQLELAAIMQEFWSDNAVSVTVTFTPGEAEQLAPMLNHYQYRLKSVSFLPKVPEGAYAQMPYEAITEEEYWARVGELKALNLKSVTQAKGTAFCDGDACTIL